MTTYGIEWHKGNVLLFSFNLMYFFFHLQRAPVWSPASAVSSCPLATASQPWSLCSACLEGSALPPGTPWMCWPWSSTPPTRGALATHAKHRLISPIGTVTVAEWRVGWCHVGRPASIGWLEGRNDIGGFGPRLPLFFTPVLISLVGLHLVTYCTLLSLSEKSLLHFFIVCKERWNQYLEIITDFGALSSGHSWVLQKNIVVWILQPNVAVINSIKGLKSIIYFTQSIHPWQRDY